jgi:hypothetical protein
MARIVDSGNTLTSPVWAGDFLDREHLMPGGAKLDAAQFNAYDAVVVTTTAQAAAAATSISVAALSGAIPAGTILYFGEAGELARLSSAAAAGATSLAVDAIPAQIESGDVAVYAGTSGIKRVLSGTPIGRTYTERDAGTGFGPAVSTDDEIYLVAFEVTDASVNADVELYRPGSIVKETFVPGWAGFATNLKTALRARYQCVNGVA